MGVITAEQANEIATVCELDRFDVGAIGAGAAEIGNPAGAVVKRLKELTDAPVHHGATSQDAVDTAAMLVTKRALGPLRHDLHAAADAAAAARRGHRDTPIIGRTLLAGAADDVRPEGRGLDARARRGGRRRRPRPAVGAARRAGRHAGDVGGLEVVSGSRATSASTRRSSRGTRAAATSASWRARSASPPARSASPRATSPCSPRPRSARCARAAAAARRACRTSTTRSPPSARSAASSRRRATSRPCWPRWCRSTSAPPAPGTANGARSPTS